MFSVCSKSFIFAVAGSYNIKTLIFAWLCAVIDFFAIFFIVSWVFYNPNNNDNNDNSNDGIFNFSYSILGQIWVWKIIIGIGPMVSIGSIIGFIIGIVGARGEFTDRYTSCCENAIITAISTIIVTMLWYVMSHSS